MKGGREEERKGEKMKNSGGERNEKTEVKGRRRESIE